MKIYFFSQSGEAMVHRTKYSMAVASVRNMIILGFYVKSVSLERSDVKEVSRQYFSSLVSACHLLDSEANRKRRHYSKGNANVLQSV